MLYTRTSRIWNLGLFPFRVIAQLDQGVRYLSCVELGFRVDSLTDQENRAPENDVIATWGN